MFPTTFSNVPVFVTMSERLFWLVPDPATVACDALAVSATCDDNYAKQRNDSHSRTFFASPIHPEGIPNARTHLQRRGKDFFSRPHTIFDTKTMKTFCGRVP